MSRALKTPFNPAHYSYGRWRVNGIMAGLVATKRSLPFPVNSANLLVAQIFLILMLHPIRPSFPSFSYVFIYVDWAVETINTNARVLPKEYILIDIDLYKKNK